MPPEFDPYSLKRNYGVNFMILTTGDDRSFISTCPPEFDPDSLKRNDGANFNCILDCPQFGHTPKCFGLQVFAGKGWLFAKNVFM